MSARTWFALALVGLVLALWAVIILLERWERRAPNRDTRAAVWLDDIEITTDEWRDRFLWDDWRDHSPGRAEPRRRYKPWMDDR